MIRLLLADDHSVVREGVRRVLALAEDFEVVGEAADGWDLLALARTTPADLLVTDLSMPGPHGVELIKRLREALPRLPILAFTMHADNQLATRVLRAGAKGYLTKDSEPGELIAAIRRIVRGQRYVDPGVSGRLLLDTQGNDPPHAALSNREFQVLTLLASGSTVTAIARELKLSVKTISTHKARLMLKLGLSSGAELVRYALGHGLVR
ncbi:MAG: response regulator transcription factor [Zoogloeaceae bacterium]|nr:response regulator transcription factor [Zoogloeaceae bacterium]